MPKTNFTVAELIEALQKLPQELPVLVTGYESGYEDFYTPAVMSLSHQLENTYYDGAFQIPEGGENNLISAVILEREVRDD